MRIISQFKGVDINYDSATIYIEDMNLYTNFFSNTIDVEAKNHYCIKAHTNNTTYIIGDYETNKRALEVMKEIRSYYEQKDYTMGSVYEMPEK